MKILSPVGKDDTITARTRLQVFVQPDHSRVGGVAISMSHSRAMYVLPPVIAPSFRCEMCDVARHTCQRLVFAFLTPLLTSFLACGRSFHPLRAPVRGELSHPRRAKTLNSYLKWALRIRVLVSAKDLRMD